MGSMPATGPRLQSAAYIPPMPAEPIIGSASSSALTIGRLVHPQRGIVERMRYGGDQHALLFGPNGKGKGTRVLINNLLEMRDSSIVVVDPKAELAAVTAPYRLSLGPVVIINPYGVLTSLPGYGDLRSWGFNPLAALDPSSPYFNAHASAIADAIISLEGKEPFFPLSARSLIACLVMYVVIEARQQRIAPTMARVRELLCEPSDGPHAGNHYKAIGLPALAAKMMSMGHVGLRNKAAQFTEWNREVHGVVSTAKIQTESFDDDHIRIDLSQNGFDFRAIKKQPITVYVVLPPDMMERQSKWLRLVLTSALLSVLRLRMPGEPKTIFMIDDFFSLGHLEIISTVWSLVRGYGIQMLPVLQDLNQLKKLYPEMWETFVGMAGVVMSYSPNDHSTSEWLSRRTGDTTRISKSKSLSYNEGSSGGTGSGSGPGGFSSSSNSGWSLGTSESTNTNEVKSTLISAHRLRGMRPGFMVTAMDGVSNIVPTYTPPYYDILKLAQRARRNPYYLG